MYVCICNKVSDRDIRIAAQQGIETMDQLAEELKVATCCGRCSDCAKELLRECHSESNDFSPLLAFS